MFQSLHARCPRALGCGFIERVRVFSASVEEMPLTPILSRSTGRGSKGKCDSLGGVRICEAVELFPHIGALSGRRNRMDSIEEAWRQVRVIRCQLGDREALAELFLRHNPRLAYYLRRMLGRDDVADVQQEIWLTVIRGIGRLKS